jgi:hypothetical protein
VIDEGATVEDDVLDAGLGGTLGDELADGGGCCGVGAGLEALRRSVSSVEADGKRLAGNVVDDLGVDVLGRTMNADRRGRPLATALS